MKRGAYNKVPAAELQEPTKSQRKAYARQQADRKQLVEKLSSKIHAFGWIVTDLVVLWLTNFVDVCVNYRGVNRTFFNVGVVTGGIFAALIGYAAIYVPYAKGVTLEIQVYAPRVIPTAAVFMVITSLSFLIGLWPVYGILTPVILFLNFMGLIMSAHFVPFCP